MRVHLILDITADDARRSREQVQEALEAELDGFAFDVANDSSDLSGHTLAVRGIGATAEEAAESARLRAPYLRRARENRGGGA